MLINLHSSKKVCSKAIMLLLSIYAHFSLKPYVVTLHLNSLVKTVQMKGHNIGFCGELTKIIPNYHQILPLIYSSAVRPLLYL